MSWCSGGNLYAGSWTSSNYAGLGILFENLPATGENGASPLLNDGGVAGDEVRWELLSASGVTLTEFNEDGSFASNGIGSFTYRSFVNNASVGDFTVTINSAAQVLTATVNLTMPQMSVSVQAEHDSQVVASSVAFTMPQMQVLAAGNTIVPVFSASVNFTMPQMIVQVNRELNTYNTTKIRIGMPQMQVSIDATQRVGPTTGTYTQPSGRPVNFKLN